MGSQVSWESTVWIVNLALVLSVALLLWLRRRDKAKTDAEEHFRALFERVPVGLYRTTPDGRIVDANAALVQMMGYPDRESLLAVNAAQCFVHPEDRQRERELLERDGYLQGFEVQQRRRDGAVIWVRDTARAVRDGSGRVVYYEGSLEDITERKRATEALRESEQRYRDLFAAAQRQAQELSLLDQVRTAIAREMDLKSLFRKVVEAIAETFGYTQVSLYLLEGEELVLEHQVGYHQVIERIPITEGISGRVARRGKAVLLTDVRSAPAFLGAIEGIVSEVCVPLHDEGRVCGILNVESRQGVVLSEADLKLVQALGQHVDTAIARARLYGEARRGEQRYRALQAMVLDITAPHELSELLRAIVERAARLLGASGGGLYLCDPERQETRCVVSYNTVRDYTGTVLKYGEGAAGVVAQTGKPLVIDDYRVWPQRAKAFERDRPFTAVLSVPMMWQGEVIGVIHVLEDAKVRRFTPEDVELLSVFANHAAIAVQNRRLYEQAQLELAERRRAEEELRRRNEELARLYETALEAAGQLDVSRLLPAIVRRANDLLHGVGAGIYLYRPQRDDLEYVAACGVAEPLVGHVLQRGEGMAGRVLATGETLVVDDYHHWEGRSPLFDFQEVGSLLSVPIRWGDQVLGVVEVQRPLGQGYDESDVRLLTLFANQMAVALVNARHYSEMRQYVRRLELLYRAGTDILAALGLEQRLRVVMDAAMAAIPAAQKGSLHLLDEARNVLVMKAGHGFGPEVWAAATCKVGEGYTGWAFAHNQPLVLHDVQGDPRTVPIELPEMKQIKSAMVVPLVVKDRPIGTISLGNIERCGAFGEADLRTLSAFAAQAAIAIENAQLYDLAQRELAERTRTAEALRALIEASPLAIFTLDRAGNVTMWSAAAERMFGWRQEEVLGMRLPIVAEDQMAEFDALRAKVLRGEALTGVEVRRWHKNGSPVDVSISAAPLRDPSGQVVAIMAVLADVTGRKRAEEEQRKLEAQLRHAQKMEAVGLLAGGVAHEFNNLLTVIQGNAELALSSLGPDEPGHREVVTIRRTAERAATLTRAILAFSRRQVLHPTELDLNACLTDLLRMLRRLIGESIELRTEFAPGLEPVWADRGAVEQAVVNLALNARDAMPEGGVLTIATTRVEADEGFCATHPEAKPGPYARLTVADTGVGMDEAVRAHLFEPFFTTKEVGKGSGLGLSAVYGIVTQHNGWVEVESTVGRGSRFDLYLPLAAGEQLRPATPAQQAAMPAGKGTILLAEDEGPVRDLVQRMLGRLGYQVLTAADGAEAVEVFRANRERIDLLLLDAVMPRLSGPKVYEAIRTLRPDVPVVFMTGYSSEIVAQQSESLAGRVVLQKPFGVADLGQALKEAMR